MLRRAAAAGLVLLAACTQPELAAGPTAPAPSDACGASKLQQLVGKIKKTAAAYGIAPIHMVGAIVGEHTYNVDAYDSLQSYYVKAAAYAGNSFRFAYDGEGIADFVARPEFSQCAAMKDSYKLWSCREDVWEAKFRGRSVGGKASM